MSDHFCFDWLTPIYDKVLPKRKPSEFLEVLNAQPDDKILEIGAGTGRITKFYASEVDHLVLLDPSEQMLEKAKTKVASAEIVIGIVEDMKFEDESFSKIIAFDSFHHWIDHNKGLKEVFRVLQKGGEFYLVDINPDTLRGKMLILLERILRMKSNFFNPEVMERMVETAGFKNISYLKIGNGMTYLTHAKKI